MFHRALTRLAANSAKLRRKLVKKPWGTRSLPATPRSVFMSKFLKGKKGTKLKAAHVAFKKLSRAQVKSFGKIAAKNAKEKKSLKLKVKNARTTSYGLFVKKHMGVIYAAERPNFKDRKKLFRAVSKQVSAKYKNLSSSAKKSLELEAAKRRKQGKAFIEKLVRKQK
mmetsp:Transcript_37924/g.52595  ORF Transcript_37924/g.52595 Transcript_37924/m.52595 type:complete len:167 (+) Transcript_37924:45-545(+)